MNADFHSLTVASAESGVDRTRRAKRAKRVRGAVRSYTLSLYPNAGKAEAAFALAGELAAIGLPQPVDVGQMAELDTTLAHVIVLRDGNY